MAVSTTITVQHRVEDLAFALYEGLFSGLPLDAASDAGAALVRTLGPLTAAHKTALRNLRLAFPNETERWRREVALAMWASIGRTAGEFPHLGEINAYRDDGRMEVSGAERLDAVRESGKGAVFISGHFSNWEIMAMAITQRGLTCHMTYRPANNPLIDARIQRLRRHYGAVMQSAKGREGGMGLLRGLARGESVALMNDQKYNEGVGAPFFGHEAMTADGPTRLALRFGVPLIPFSLRRLGDAARFRLTIHEPIPLLREAPIEVAARDAVGKINAFVEARVREAPEQWFWVHKRWSKETWAAAGV